MAIVLVPWTSNCYCIAPHDPLRTSVDVEAFGAGEAEEGGVEGGGEVDGEAGGGTDGGDEGDAGHQGLLEELEAGAPAEEEQAVVEAVVAGHDLLADHLVQCVVAADVLAEADQVSVEIEQAGGVEATGLLEDGLGLAEALGEGSNHQWVDARAGREDLAALNLHRLQRRLAADAAAGCGEEVALQSSDIERAARAQGDGDDVEVLDLVLVQAVADLDEVVAARDDALAEEETDGELEVVAGGAHRDSDALLG